MENKNKPKVAETIGGGGRVINLQLQSDANKQQLELIYLVRRQWRESQCLVIHSITLLLIAFVFLIAAWLVSVCPKLGVFITSFINFQAVIAFDSVKNGLALERSVKVPTEILILITIFLWRFSPAAFFKKESKEKSE